MHKRPDFSVILAARLSRRTVLAGGAAAVGLAACAHAPAPRVATSGAKPFQGIAPHFDDAFTLAAGYRSSIVARWGDSLVTGTPDFDTRRLAKSDWITSAAVEAQHSQFGSNCDAVQYFPLGRGRAARGLLAVNHEYFSAELVFPGNPGAFGTWQQREAWIERHPNSVELMQAAHGVTVMEVFRDSNGWSRDLKSRYTRRITARTPTLVTGPAAGHALLRTDADRDGTTVLGTFANCAAGKTPWGTYLTSEENVDDYFTGARTALEANRDPAFADAMRRFPYREHSVYGWSVQDARFDMRRHPREALRFGWMVEIDPHDPRHRPRKRTALGRFQHEGANTIVGKSGHVAAYMGDDEKFEYVYKFVTRDRFDPANPAANRDLLDHGTLYAARFDADGGGEWLPLVHDENGPLNSRAGFASQGDVVIKARAAADLLGATPMDRPEDVEPSPRTGFVYVACTKAENRADQKEAQSWSGRETSVAPNPANPRPDNRSGHIIEMAEAGEDATATRFTWNVFLLAGDPAAGRYLVDARELANAQLAAQDTYFGGYAGRESQPPIHCPDNLGIDPAGRLWIVTDTDGHEWPNNGCFVTDTSGPERGRLRQLASGPLGCEVCGCEFTPDGHTLFLSIQHPGEGGTIEAPRSHWPDGGDLPARASLVAIEREDGGPV